MRRLAPLSALALSLTLTTQGCDPAPFPDGTAVVGDVAGDVHSPDALATVEGDALAADLAYLREEEKLARDVYTTLYAAHGLMPLVNIAGSEQIHTDQVAVLLAAKGLPDPVVDDAVGAFVNADLAALYGELVAAGLPSQVAALTVGATVEDLDIVDLRAMLARTDDPAALALYANLQCGSRNHLRVFVSQLASRGATYTAQFMPQAEVDAVAATGRESRGGDSGAAVGGAGASAGGGGGGGGGPGM